MIGGDIEGFAEKLDREGVDAAHTVAEREEFNHDVYWQVVIQMIEKFGPSLLLLPHSVNVLGYGPAVAKALSLPLVTNAIDLELNDGLTVAHGMYGGKVETTVEVDAEPVAVTLRGGEWPAAEDTDADVLVSIGRGIEEEDNLPLIEELVDVTGATLATSRPIVDNGWLPKNRQVGQSGKFVTPDTYIATGISGAVQHVAGMKNAETIIAINTDSNAPIFDIADYGIVDDVEEVVPELIKEFGGEALDV